MDLMKQHCWILSVTSGEGVQQLHLAEPSLGVTHSSAAAASRGADEDADAEEKRETGKSENNGGHESPTGEGTQQNHHEQGRSLSPEPLKLGLVRSGLTCLSFSSESPC